MIGVARIDLVLLATAVAAVGCGSSTKNSSAPTTTSSPPATTTSPTPPSTTTTAAGPGALQAEANAAAAGDIPDNQVFLVFRNGAAGYSMKYPEGWAEFGSAKAVTFRDKNNIVRIVVSRGPAPTMAFVRAEVGKLRGVHIQTAPHRLTVGGKPTVAIVYSTISAPNAVTGKRVKLIVDRYYVWKGGRRAVVDLGTPEGVDNVDAYRMMIESFEWR
jgi:hypothetical protein